MTVTMTGFKAIVVCSSVTVASNVVVPCSAGARVYSLSAWSGFWVDGLVVRCTGDDEEHTIPPDFYDHPGGVEEEDMCAGTGGVESIEWGVPKDFSYLMVYANITCLDNETYYLADERSYDEWNITGNRTISCDEGEYVQGVEYDITFVKNSSFPYLNNINFTCSSSTLDPLCTGCSGDKTLKSEEDQPEYCELPSCSEKECCEPVADETGSITATDIIGVVSAVVTAIIISGSAWAFKKIKKRHAVATGDEDVPAEDTPNH